MAKAIHQEVTIAGSPQAVYEVLTSTEKFEAMTGGRAAKISGEVGGRSTMFGGDIQAHNVELVPGKLIVQAWRSNAWPEGVYSICRFSLSAEGGGTKMVFDQAGYPDEAHDMLDGGWHQMYWQPLDKMLGGS